MQTFHVANKADILRILEMFPKANKNQPVYGGHIKTAYDTISIAQQVELGDNGNCRYIFIKYIDDDAWEYGNDPCRTLTYKFSHWDNSWQNKVAAIISDILRLN